MHRWGVAALGAVLALAGCGNDEGPTLSTPATVVSENLSSLPAFEPNGREPVLLVHGTATNTADTWSWAFAPALRDAGYDVFMIDLPERALGDIQVAAEFVVGAVREISTKRGSRVDVIGHSQGGLEPRWAVKFWPDVREAIDDLVTLASPHHGAYSADGSCATGSCPPAVWQMTTGSNFLTALNEGDETPGTIDVTSIYSQFDELVQPAAIVAPTAALDGAVNVLVQDLCPGRPVHHVGMVHDAVVFALVLDALENSGPADPARIDPTLCNAIGLPGADPATILEGNLLLYGNAIVALTQGPSSTSEPPLAGYVFQP